MSITRIALRIIDCLVRLLGYDIRPEREPHRARRASPTDSTTH